MEMIIPVIAALLLIPGMQIRNIDDFSRLSKHVGQRIALVDDQGIVREGLLTSATADAIKMEFAGGEKSFSKKEVMSAERLHDGSADGAIKGAIFGAVIGLVVAAEAGADGAQYVLESIAIYGSIGFVLDATQVNRQPIYGATCRAAPAPKPALRFTFRF